MSQLTARDLLVRSLKDLGAAGLCNPDEECGCRLDDLVPCEADPSDCLPAKQINPIEIGDHDFCMVPLEPSEYRRP